MISYSSDSNTVVALFGKLESILQKTVTTQAIFKNESFHKGAMLVPRLVLSNILHSWKEKEFLNALETKRIVQPKVVGTFRAWDASFKGCYRYIFACLFIFADFARKSKRELLSN